MKKLRYSKKKNGEIEKKNEGTVEINKRREKYMELRKYFKYKREPQKTKKNKFA